MRTDHNKQVTQPRPCGEINGEWTSLYGRICSGVTLWYDTTQKEMQAPKRTQWEFCLTQNKPVCKQDWQMSHHLYQIWKVNHKSQQVAFNQHTDVITVIVVSYYSLIGFYFPFSFNSMFVSVSFESGFISMLFLFVSVLILVFEASANGNSQFVHPTSYCSWQLVTRGQSQVQLPKRPFYALTMLSYPSQQHPLLSLVVTSHW